MLHRNVGKGITALGAMFLVGNLLTGPALAQAGDVDAPGYMHGPMMGYGHGWGAGPGMMGGGWGMGPGMMGGMGMMGGHGMGPGMMMGGWGTGHAFSLLNLTDEQRAKINKIMDAEQRKHWEVAGKMMEQHAKLRDLYAAETPDPKKIGAVYAEMSKFRQQMIETHVQSFNEMQAVLTKEQREQLRQWHRGGSRMGPRGGYGPGNMPPGMGPGMMR